MSIIHIKAADTEWFDGPGWYVITKEDFIFGPYSQKIFAEYLDSEEVTEETYANYVQELPED